MACVNKRKKRNVHLRIIRAKALQLSKLRHIDVIIYKINLNPVGTIYDFVPSGTEIDNKDIIEIIKCQEKE